MTPSSTEPARYPRLKELLEEYDERVAAGPPRTEEDRRATSALVIELQRLTDECIRPLLAWHDATVNIIAALAIYGEQASLQALVSKARELNDWKPEGDRDVWRCASVSPNPLIPATERQEKR